MTPYSYHAHEFQEMSRAEKMAARDAIRQAKLVRKAAREAAEHSDTRDHSPRGLSRVSGWVRSALHLRVADQVVPG